MVVDVGGMIINGLHHIIVHYIRITLDIWNLVGNLRVSEGIRRRRENGEIIGDEKNNADDMRRKCQGGLNVGTNVERHSTLRRNVAHMNVACVFSTLKDLKGRYTGARYRVVTRSM